MKHKFSFIAISPAHSAAPVCGALSILGCQRLREKVRVRYTFNCVLWFREFEQQLSASNTLAL
jgi:hypothetical protein